MAPGEVLGAATAVDRRVRGRQVGEGEGWAATGLLVGEEVGWVAVGWEVD